MNEVNQSIDQSVNKKFFFPFQNQYNKCCASNSYNSISLNFFLPLNNNVSNDGRPYDDEYGDDGRPYDDDDEYGDLL